MTTKAERAHELFSAAAGEDEGAGAWFLIDQERIDTFAEVTEDRQFIHVDPEGAAEHSPWGVTIAHGFLTLSMLSHLVTSIPLPPERVDGLAMGINYGFDRVRFLSPVKVDSRIRASSVVKSADLKDPNTLQLTRTITVEIEGEERPALVAEWITRLVYA